MTEKYSDEELLNHLAELAEDGQVPTFEKIQESDGPCYWTYNTRFGSMDAAAKRIGLEPSTPGPDPEYTESELIEWIDAFVETFGVVPSYRDIRNWPGPSSATYERYFESWIEAVEAAGYEPRGKQ